MKLKWALFFGLSSAFAMPSAAQAQVVVDSITQAVANSAGNRPSGPDACFRGELSSPRRTAEARQQAEAAMQSYFQAAQADGPADVRAAYTRQVLYARWTRAGQDSPVTAVQDPLARLLRAGAARGGTASEFVRGGYGRMALGVWPVMAPDGVTRLGHYRVEFTRESRGYKILELTLVEGAADALPVRHFCAIPGDVDDYAASEVDLRPEVEGEPSRKPND